MSLARSTFYAKNHVDFQRLKEEADLWDSIERIILACPGYGCRRMTYPLKEKTKAKWKQVLRVKPQEVYNN